MKRKALVLLSIIFAAVSLAANDYYPNRGDDNFDYKSEIATGNVVTDNVIETYGSNWKKHSNFGGFGEKWIWTGNYSNELYLLQEDGNYAKLVDFDDAVGTHYTGNFSMCATRAEIVAKGQTVSVPAGVFEDVVIVGFSGPCNDAGIVTQAYAKGVGIIRWENSMIAGSRFTNMISGTVNGVSYPKKPEPAFKVSASADGYNYYFNMMPGPGMEDRPAPKGYFQLQIENMSGNTLNVHYTSGCLFDMAIKNADGEVVKRYLDGRMCTANAPIIQFESGQTATFGDYIEFTDENGHAIPNGSYTLEIYNTGTPQWKASLPFTISTAY